MSPRTYNSLVTYTSRHANIVEEEIHEASTLDVEMIAQGGKKSVFFSPRKEPYYRLPSLRLSALNTCTQEQH